MVERTLQIDPKKIRTQPWESEGVDSVVGVASVVDVEGRTYVYYGGIISDDNLGPLDIVNEFLERNSDSEYYFSMGVVQEDEGMGFYEDQKAVGIWKEIHLDNSAVFSEALKDVDMRGI